MSNRIYTQKKYRLIGLGLIICIYLILGSLYAYYIPFWQAPDEPAHYNYILQIAQHGCCPIVEIGDWNSGYLDILKSLRFAPESLDNMSSIQYEDHQPPLYYLLSLPVFRFTNGSLIYLRLWSVFIGVFIIINTFIIASILAPSHPSLAVFATMFVAFIPQHIYILSSVNNDSLAWCLISIGLLLSSLYVKNIRYIYLVKKLINIKNATLRIMTSIILIGLLAFITLLFNLSGQYLSGLIIILIAMIIFIGSRFQLDLELWGLGIIVGLAFLTKVSTYFLLVVVLVAITLHQLQCKKNTGTGVEKLHVIRESFLAYLTFLIPAVVLGSIWWIRNLVVYGIPDFLGLIAHDNIVYDQMRTIDFINEFGSATYIKEALNTTFVSFWGQFGWMQLPLTGWSLSFVQMVTIISIAGLILQIFLRVRGRKPGDSYGYILDNKMLVLLILTSLLTLAAYIYYNTEFLQLQGRYLFTGLVPIGIWLSLGLDGWSSTLGRIVSRGKGIITCVLAVIPLSLVAFNFYLLFKVITPNLSP